MEKFEPVFCPVHKYVGTCGYSEGFKRDVDFRKRKSVAFWRITEDNAAATVCTEEGSTENALVCTREEEKIQKKKQSETEATFPNSPRTSKKTTHIMAINISSNGLKKIIQEAIRYTYIFLQYMINVMYAISMQGILKRLSWLWVRKCAGIRFSIQTLHPS